MNDEHLDTPVPFNPKVVEGLTAAFDERFRLVAQAVPELITALLGERSSTVVLLPSRATRATRKHDVAVLCGDGTDNDPFRILHVEWQTRGDAHMPIRMLVYQAELHRAYRAPVASAVVYLIPSRGRSGDAPTKIWLHHNQPATAVHYRSVLLPATDAASFIRRDEPSLAILSSACRGGCAFRALQRSLDLLRRTYQTSDAYVQILALHFAFAELSSAGRRWKMAAQSVGIDVVEDVELDGFTMLVVKRYREGFADGLAQGRQEGRQEGRQQALQAVEERVKRSIDNGDIELASDAAIERLLLLLRETGNE